MTTISDKTVTFLDLAVAADVDPDDHERKITFSQMTARTALCCVFNENGTRIIQSFTFSTPKLGKSEFQMINWRSLLEITSDILANRVNVVHRLPEIA